MKKVKILFFCFFSTQLNGQPYHLDDRLREKHLGSHVDKKFQNRVASPTEWLHTREDLLRQVMPQNAIVAEIGVQRGGFAIEILNLTHPRKIFLIDCWEEQDVRVYSEIHDPQEIQHRNYEYVIQRFCSDERVSIIKSFSVPAALLFDNEFFDWVYIDANHAYEAVKADLEAWWPKIKKGGFIAGHDYIIRDDSCARFGVICAVNEFVEKYGLRIDYLTNELYASFVIQKPRG